MLVLLIKKRCLVLDSLWVYGQHSSFGEVRLAYSDTRFRRYPRESEGTRAEHTHSFMDASLEERKLLSVMVRYDASEAAALALRSLDLGLCPSPRFGVSKQVIHERLQST